MVGGNSLALVDEIEPDALAHLGYPIAEMEEDGTFVLTKVPDSPGRVSLETAKEQLLYEIHDPRAYITPDVIANFTTLEADARWPRPRARDGRDRQTQNRNVKGRTSGASRATAANWSSRSAGPKRAARPTA